jgi:3-hydroxyisobutyrate dehydrogenase-like beta-hydroxyacid dehydrogenase
MERRIALIGFGEAASAFAGGLNGRLTAYDRKTDAAATRVAKLADFAAAGVAGAQTPGEALAGARVALSLVTADQALAAAEAADGLVGGAFWFDMNSVAPATKRAAAEAIAGRGGYYVDVAVMAPVHPARLDVPLLVGGPEAGAGAELLRELGFTSVQTIAGPVGAASAVKMIRSVMVKGIEALSAECMLAAEAAGVRGAVIASLDASWPGADWARRFDYNLDRMLVHGVRRAEEMAEVTRTLGALGISPIMAEGAVSWQQALGELGIAPPEGLDAKLAAIRTRMKELGA